MINPKWNFSILIIFAILFFSACEEKSKTEKAVDKIEETAEEIGDVFRSDKEEVKHDLKDAKKKLEKKLNDLRESLGSASDDAKKGIKGQIKKLESKIEKLDSDS